MHCTTPNTISKASSNNQPYNHQKLTMIGINKYHQGLLDQWLNPFKIRKDHVSDQFRTILIQIISNKYLHHQLIISQLLIWQIKTWHKNNKTRLTTLIVSQLILVSSLFVQLHKGQVKDKKMYIQMYKIHAIMLQIRL